MATFREYEKHDALGLADLVRKGEVTSAELLEAALSRIEARNPSLNAVIHRMDARARRTAEGQLGEGPFKGVPLLLKDLMGTLAGEPETYGSRLLADHVPDHDSELVARLQRAGFVVAGKTNCPEYGIMGVTEPKLFGPTRNPWNTEHTPGGSSGGSAAAVAAGMVPLAHANDGGGSIRIPASCTGLFGLKPSRGRNPLGPDYGEGWGGMVVEHAVTRSVRDSATLLDATRGLDPGAPYAAPAPERPYAEELAREPGRLRIAFTTESLYGESTHPDCRAAVEDVAKLCEGLGHEVERAHPPYDKAALRRAYLQVVAVSVARLVDDYAARLGKKVDPDQVELETWLLYLIGHRLTATEYAEAVEQMHAAGRRLAPFFERYDVLLTSTLAHPPARIGAFASKLLEQALMRTLRTVPARRLLLVALDQMAAEKLEATANTMLFNQTGQPAMSVPLHWSSEGLPIGTQFAARYGEEDLLLRLAHQLESARPWWDRRPEAYRDA